MIIMAKHKVLKGLSDKVISRKKRVKYFSFNCIEKNKNKLINIKALKHATDEKGVKTLMMKNFILEWRLATCLQRLNCLGIKPSIVCNDFFFFKIKNLALKWLALIQFKLFCLEFWFQPEFAKQKSSSLL